MSNLIVDFPQHQRGAKRAVRFSSDVVIQFFERRDPDTRGDLYFRQKDYREMKRHNKQLVQDMHRRYRSQKSMESQDSAEVFVGCELTGIENLLTPELIERTMARKAGCVNAVLDEQDDQDAAGCCDPERLARASRQYSMWSAQRSRKIGMMHQMI